MNLLLATLHARYSHSSLALPSLAAALAGLTGVRTELLELTIHEPHDQLLRRIVSLKPDLLGFSCYIWNIGQVLRLADDVKKILPETFIILGGPEASYGSFRLMEQNPALDCIVQGEGETTLRECVERFCVEKAVRPSFLEQVPGLCLRLGEEIVATAERPAADLDRLPSPFAAGLVDRIKPLVYYETSRGCPFSCAFCISSVGRGVRSYSMERIKSDLLFLMETGARTVKLVDRTFNFDAARANEIWRFILERNRESRFHFEIAADLLTDENLALLERVPPGMFRFEIGVQSGKEETLAAVDRKSDLDRLFRAVRTLLTRTPVTLHLDLVAGLPRERYDDFLQSLQSLLDLSPHHIQVEPLKVLKGTAMRKIARQEGWRHSDSPPYKILRTPWLSFEEICRIEEIGRMLDLVYNSGAFPATLRVLRGFVPLARFFSRLAETGAGEGGKPLSREALHELVGNFSLRELGPERGEEVREAVCFDYLCGDYPAGNLPAFFVGRGAPSAKTGRVQRFLEQLQPEGGSRIRIFTRSFERDFRSPSPPAEPVELTFIYLSAPGQGLKVVALEGRELEAAAG